jgi:hypothetical protein
MVNEMKMNIFVCEEAPEISERNNIKKLAIWSLVIVAL